MSKALPIGVIKFFTVTCTNVVRQEIRIFYQVIQNEKYDLSLEWVFSD